MIGMFSNFPCRESDTWKVSRNLAESPASKEAGYNNPASLVRLL